MGRDDFAVAEDGTAGDVIEMPVGENDGELPHASALERAADIPRMLD